MKKIISVLVSSVLLFISCTEDELNPPLCLSGDCDGEIYIPFPKDSRGYYHVDLDFIVQGTARFPIFIEAEDVHPYYYYNDMGVVQGAFSSPSLGVYEGGYQLPIVQETTLLLSNSNNTTEYTPRVSKRKWAKRIVGPIPQYFVGDTVTIRAEIYWDGGDLSKSKFFLEKLIIE